MGLLDRKYDHQTRKMRALVPPSTSKSGNSILEAFKSEKSSGLPCNPRLPVFEQKGKIEDKRIRERFPMISSKTETKTMAIGSHEHAS